jgi:hypothetical protein
MSTRAFVYTELHISEPFAEVPWQEMNPILKAQPGLLHKTWLSGVHTHSLGGFYAFDTVENATRFVTDYFPSEPAALNVAFTTRLFDAAVVGEASKFLPPFTVLSLNIPCPLGGHRSK